ncbi:MaoC family dehydratase [Nocardioides humi]|uniref:MaoC family dehydratase n=1 Tax=Nocardioides humi TaxID=449461 RepID=A0ABN1ZWK3_9ACTN|nr:MaoC family dehydratase [Nocardioides humi]
MSDRDINRDDWPRTEQRGFWYDELESGVVYAHRPGRTVTEYDNLLFSSMSMNPQGLHIDFAESEALPPFHRPLVNSMFTLATLVGLSVSHLTRGTIVANLGFTSVRFPHPVFHGDTLYGETVVLDKRLSSSRPGAGIVSLEHVARNEHGDVVATAVRQVMMRRRPEESER